MRKCIFGMTFFYSVVMLLRTTSTLADDAYYAIPLAELTLTEGTLADSEADSAWSWHWRGLRLSYAALDGPGEALVVDRNLQPFNPVIGSDLSDPTLVVKAPVGNDVAGRLVVRNRWDPEYSLVRFKISAAMAKSDARATFWQARRNYYTFLQDQGIPGGAWFRHQAAISARELGPSVGPARGTIAPVQNEIEIERTFDLFSGGRAISENLQLDRLLDARADGGEQQSIQDLKGITVREMDWDKLLEGKQPALDPLAKRIPADQHVLFLSSISAALRLADEAMRGGTPVLQGIEPRAEDAQVLPRYERQLGVSRTMAVEDLGPQMIQSLALTGSDPYFRVGTDVALLCEAKDSKGLAELLLMKVKSAAAQHPAAQPVRGDIGGIKYEGFQTPSRELCSYVAELGDVIVVTNSLAQLERLAAVASAKTPAISSLKEYQFFRDRYRLDNPHEVGFLFLSDATIRRWCGPRWRIANSRRTQDAAVLADLQATHFDRLARGQIQVGPVYTELAATRLGELQLGPDGIHSSTYNTLKFQTPIVELPCEKVSRSEADAYVRWRDGYQQNWRWAFDPIGVQFCLEGQRISADLTVMPLIMGTDYRWLTEVSAGAAVKPGAGDPHGALVHMVVALNRDSTLVRQTVNYADQLGGGVSIDILSWIGDHLAVYVDADPFWDKLSQEDWNESWEARMETSGYGIPVGIRVDVRNAFKLASFLTAARAYVDQAAPNLTRWETRTYREQTYTRVAVREGAPVPPAASQFAIYYGLVGNGLLVTLNEDLFKRAIDRQMDAKPQDTEKDSEAKHIWLGKNAAVEIQQKGLMLVGALTSRQYRGAMQRLAWNNLPILNEWKRRFPNQDPVALHESFWHTRLICPAGGQYVWNEQYQTMESSELGHPAQPKVGPAIAPLLELIKAARFGLTFEHDGLRARGEIDR